ncbi:MAG: TerB family tellurite resistance protein [Gemmatimonadaceae bacterium]
MLDAIRSLFRAGAPDAAARSDRTSGSADPLHLAACALLLEVAYADGEFSDSERAHLESVLARHFGLPEDAGRELIALAEEERRKSIDHFRHTSILQRGYDTGQKMVLAEVMWGLVLADGQIAEHEHYLTRKIANLLDLEPGYLSAAKRKAEGG